MAEPEITPKQAGKRRATRTSWKPGQSGNPGGRPASLREVVDLARKHTPRAIQRLVELTNSEHGPTAARACEILLDRAYGRPTQPIGTDPENPLEVRVGVGAILSDPAARAALQRAVLGAAGSAGDTGDNRLDPEPRALDVGPALGVAGVVDR